MKKIVICLILIVSITFAISTVATAAEQTDHTSETVSETTNTEEYMPNSNGLEKLYSRINEAWSSGDLTSYMNIIYSVVSIVVLLVVKFSNSRSSKEVKISFDESSKTTSGKINELISASNESTNAVNSLADCISKETDSIKESILQNKIENKKEIEETTAAVYALANATKSFATMISTVYSGSTTIPQPIKDIVNVNYVKVINEIDPILEKEKRSE